MIGAPFGTQVTCVAAEACIMNWYTPMPMKDGSVMMKVEISSNQRGELINDAKFMININGFLKKEKDKLVFTLGNEVSAMTHRNFINTPSRPVWATMNQAPVLILGGIPDEKMILLSDSSFRDISLVELNIDSCWLGTLHCPQEKFTSSIFDTISTESTLFIRQNQLVYYFTGNYFPRTRNTPYTKGWVRVLHSRCIKKLCPVEHPSNGSEYVLALAGGNEEGFFHFGTITDGSVTFKRMPYMKSMCEIQQDPFLTNKQNVRLAVMMAHPSCVSATVNEYYLINRNAILFKVVIKDKRQCFNQSISGQNLKKTSILIKVIGSAGRCFLRTQEGPLMQGSELIPMFIGCPPGKRLAFDITLTVQYCKTTNKRFFDCLYPDPEMPCFLFSDPFFPFFLVQDLVTGESGSFNGSYVLKVIGGGTSMDNIVDYSKDDIFRYNSPNDTTKSRIWTIKDNMMDDEAFYILRHNSPGIEWLCQKNAPCNDIIPRSLHSPEFFFKIRVSTRGVDTSTYCDYQLTFILHVHGLPLSSSRALMFLWGSLYVNFGCVLLFVLWNFLVPCLQSWWSNFKKKINNIIMTESFSTYTSSSGSVPSSINIKATEIAPSEMDISLTRKLRLKKKSVISSTKVSN